MQKETTTNGIIFTWDIASSQGASFILFPATTDTPEVIKKAKAEIRQQHDVVSLHIATEEDRDYMYKGEIFRVPETRPLKWYQIEQDEKLIRKCRLAGLTAQEYVNIHVLPNVEKTEADFLAKSGTKIYNI